MSKTVSKNRSTGIIRQPLIVGFFYICQALIIVFGAIIPLVNVVTPTDDLSIRITSYVLGSLITIITGFLQLAKAHESWLLFRSTAENLKQEYHLFMQGGGGYSDPDLSSDEKIGYSLTEQKASWQQKD